MSIVGQLKFRKLLKKMPKIIIGPQIGETVKDGKVVSKDFIIWCQTCLEKKIRNHQKLTKADKKYVDSCEMKAWNGTDKEGNETKGKTCPRCRQTIVLNNNSWQEARQA